MECQLKTGPLSHIFPTIAHKSYSSVHGFDYVSDMMKTDTRACRRGETSCEEELLVRSWNSLAIVAYVHVQDLVSDVESKCHDSCPGLSGIADEVVNHYRHLKRPEYCNEARVCFFKPVS